MNKYDDILAVLGGEAIVHAEKVYVPMDAILIAFVGDKTVVSGSLGKNKVFSLETSYTGRGDTITINLDGFIKANVT